VVITARKRVGRLLGCDVWRVTGTKLLPFVKGRLHTGTPHSFPPVCAVVCGAACVRRVRCYVRSRL